MIDYMTERAIIVARQEYERRWGALLPRQEDEHPVKPVKIIPPGRFAQHWGQWLRNQLAAFGKREKRAENTGNAA